MLQTNAEDPVSEAFAPLVFPEDSLQKIRGGFSSDAAPQMDVSPLDAASRLTKPVVKALVESNRALQTPEPQVGTAPTWKNPQLIAPEMNQGDESTFAPPQEPGPDVHESNADAQVPPTASNEVMPAAVIPFSDSPVMVTEPQPAFLPPGAEAFFEAIEPVTPPQP